MKGNSLLLAENYSDRDLIESVLQTFYIIDYGYIKTVNADKTIDVIHAKRLKTYSGETLPQTETKNIEVLTLAGAGFSFQFDYKKGDKVLLLGLKDFIPKVADVNLATETKNYLHYTRETMKAIPLCVFNNNAKVTVQVDNGTMKVDTSQKIELNGNSKQFVTWSELNTALSQFATQLNTALLAATYVSVAGTPTPLAWTGGTPPSSIDISSAKTTSVVTGG